MKNRFTKHVLLTAAFIAFVGCSSKQTSEISDPWESRNRFVHNINTHADEIVLEPIAKGYRYAVPQVARSGVRNVLRNLKSPTNFANEVLQGDLDGAGHVFTRASINTLVGVGGLFDVAGHEGLTHTSEDFGQTLAVWGIDHGPYLVVPFYGPSSVRDFTGIVADAYADPLNRWLVNTDEMGWAYGRLGLTIIDTREALLDALNDLQKNSIDYYATLRSVYAQNRQALITDGESYGDLPDFE